MKGGWLYFTSLFFILFVAASIRLFALSADPPSTMSRDFISDEAWWAHNARNHSLFGKWVVDDFNQGLFAAPLHTAMVRLSFMCGGISLAQTRLVSALAGLVTIALVGVMLTRELGQWSGLAGMLILGFDYFAVMYDRLGFVEPLATALMTLAATLVVISDRRPNALALAGAVAALAYFAKANAIFFLPVPVVFLLWGRLPARTSDAGNRKMLAREVGTYFSGVLACFTLWFVFFVLPNWNQYLFQVGRLRDESRARGFALFTNFFMFAFSEEHGLIRYTLILTHALLPVGLACLWGICAGNLIVRRGFRLTISALCNLERLGLIWVIMFLPYFVGHVSYSNQRYHVFLVPLTILGVHLLGPRRHELVKFELVRGAASSRLSIIIGSLMIALPFVLYLRLPIARHLLVWTKSVQVGASLGLSASAGAAVATLILGLIFLLTIPLLLRVGREVSARVGTLAWLMLAVLLTIQLTAIGSATNRLSYSIQKGTAEVALLIGQEARVTGEAMLVFGTPNRILILLDRRWAGYGFFGKQMIPSFRPTHLIINGECSETEFAAAARDELSEWGRYVPGTRHIVHFCPVEGGGMRYAATLGAVTQREGG